MKIGAAFFTRNCLEFTQACLQTFTTESPHHVLVVDQNSQDGTQEWLGLVVEQYKKYTETEPDEVMNTLGFNYIVDKEEFPLAAKWNIAMEFFKEKGCDAGLICNNDILFNPLTVDRLIERLQKGLDAGEPLAMVTAHNLRNEIQPQTIVSMTMPTLEESSEAPSPDFSCFLLTLEAWETVGGFDEKYVPCYFEDNDFHTMLQIYDLVAISTTYAPYYHYGSITQNSEAGGVCKGELFEKNRSRFIDKFGNLPSDVDIEGLKREFFVT